jgi:ketosteroid isomerase-like protein
MSQENIELLYRGFEVWNRRDLATALAGSHADVEITPVRGAAATTYRGHEGMRRFWDDIIGTFPDFRTEVVEARELGDFVLGIVRIGGQGTGSAVASEQTVWFATEWRDRKLLWYCAYETEGDALQAIRSREKARSEGNVDLVMMTFPPAGTDYTELFRDDEAWAAFKASVVPLVDPDFKGAFVAYGQRILEFKGLDGLREAFIQWLAPWSSYYEKLEDVVAVGADRVVLLGREHGYRLDTQSEVTTDSAGVYLVRNGKIAGAEYYASQAEALEAAGLRE